MRKQFSSWCVSKLWDLWEKIAKWLIKSCTVSMCCKCFLPILTLKGNICSLEMTIGHLMIALLPVNLCCAMVHMASVHKAQTSDHFSPMPNGDGGGRGGRGLSVHRRGSALLMIAPRLRLSFWSRTLKGPPADSTGQCWVTLGLCAVPCNERYHTQEL